MKRELTDKEYKTLCELIIEKELGLQDAMGKQWENSPERRKEKEKNIRVQWHLIEIAVGGTIEEAYIKKRMEEDYEKGLNKVEIIRETRDDKNLYHSIEGDPALITKTGGYYWYKHGKLHRENGPAAVEEDPSLPGAKIERWYKEGKLHREDGPAVVTEQGQLKWYREGELHREDGPAVVLQGTRYEAWYKEGKLHRVDGPAVIYQDGTEERWHHGVRVDRLIIKTDEQGRCHAVDGPAMITPEGTQIWMKHGIMHREDGPAYEKKDGTKMWYIEGKLHREDGPAEIMADLSTAYYRKGVLHREDGPAVIRANGDRYWYKRGKLHREDGPAIQEMVQGGKYKGQYINMWYKNGKMHRGDGPAYEHPNGVAKWYSNGVEATFKGAPAVYQATQFFNRYGGEEKKEKGQKEEGKER